MWPCRSLPEGAGAEISVGIRAFQDRGTHHPSLHTIAKHEIDSREQPKMQIVAAHLAQARPIRIHPYEAFHSPRGRNAIAQEMPEWRQCVARPCKSRQKQQRQRRYDPKHEHRLPFPDNSWKQNPKPRHANTIGRMNRKISNIDPAIGKENINGT